MFLCTGRRVVRPHTRTQNLSCSENCLPYHSKASLLQLYTYNTYSKHTFRSGVPALFFHYIFFVQTYALKYNLNPTYYCRGGCGNTPGAFFFIIYFSFKLTRSSYSSKLLGYRIKNSLQAPHPRGAMAYGESLWWCSGTVTHRPPPQQPLPTLYPRLLVARSMAHLWHGL